MKFLKNPFFPNILYIVFESRIVISDDCFTESFEKIDLQNKLTGPFSIKFNSNLKGSFILHEKFSDKYLIFSDSFHKWYVINEKLDYLDWLYDKKNLIHSAPPHRLLSLEGTILSISDKYGKDWVILSYETVKLFIFLNFFLKMKTVYTNKQKIVNLYFEAIIKLLIICTSWKKTEKSK